jgi:hypothetical protein
MGLRPCLGAEVLRELLANPRSARVLVTNTAQEGFAGQDRMSAREWLGFHGFAFLIGAWNLFAVNLARTPGRWWFWIPIAAWAAVLAIHTLWYQTRGSRTVKVEPTPRVL